MFYPSWPENWLDANLLHSSNDSACVLDFEGNYWLIDYERKARRSLTYQVAPPPQIWATNRRKVYISNNLKDAIKYNFDGLYIPSFHKQLRFKNITKKKLEIIGSAHNAIELKIKEKQGCSCIFLSPIFKNNKNKKFLDVIKTNLLKKMTKNKIVLLGGINQKNIKAL